MAILNIGSLNLDHVYQVPYFSRPGESLPAMDYIAGAGGKGLNQSLAAARAGGTVCHAGCVGEGSGILIDILEKSGADISRIQKIATPTGHAVIQVTPDGENSIVVFGGANQQVHTLSPEPLFEGYGKGDYLILQNEVSGNGQWINAAKDRGMAIVFSPAPMGRGVEELPLERVDYLLCNITEGMELTRTTSLSEALTALGKKFTTQRVILTRGPEGSLFWDGGPKWKETPAPSVRALDTTAAGDTFAGYFTAGLSLGKSDSEAITWATRAAALCVQKAGAACSIPAAGEL